MEHLGNQQIDHENLTDWRKLGQALHARFGIPDLVAGAGFVAAIAGVAEPGGHRPHVTLTYSGVDVVLASHVDGRWVTPNEIELARTISHIAAEHRLRPEPGAVAQLELALDTADADRVAPFWAALLTGDPDNRIHDSVFDPTDRVPSLWFQDTDEHETPRQRWHFDLWLAPEIAEERIAAAVAAGGVIVDETEAPSFVVLADPDGNKVCICTSLDRA
ncbi:VOC family protein [Rudaeicoccus suwonensis]|nr:VOC family protein [Rudaeicoccus suwonensis]